MMSSIADRGKAENGTGNSTNCCSTTSSELKPYRTFIFSVPIIFTFILLFLFYWFYLRRTRADWFPHRMRTNRSMPMPQSSDGISRCELGVKKELREMLPIIVFKESFSVKDTECSVCLGDYEAEERLQQIPACGHSFHMDCIDLWLTTHTTCPLCRKSLLADRRDATNSSTTSNDDEEDASHQNRNRDRPRTSQYPGDINETRRVVERDIEDVVRHDEAEGHLETTVK